MKNNNETYSDDEVNDLMFANSVIFSQWCNNLIELNDLSNITDKYHEKVFYVCLWELLVNSSSYINSLEFRESQHENVLKMIEEIKQHVSDDEYFMLQYFRNCSCHIFLTKYSYLGKDWAIKDKDNRVAFYDKNGNVIKLNQYEIRNKIKNVIGQYGHREDYFKIEIRKRLNPIIAKYQDLIILKIEI